MPILRYIRILFYILVCFSGLQNAAAQHIISGKITDKPGKGIAFATAALQQLPDSAILLTTLADSEGNYKFDAGKLSNTFITAFAPGYRQSIKTLTNTTATTQKLDITLEQEAIELNAVSVSSRKPLIERKVDRIIFNVENSIAAIGSDALEAISKAPGVRVTSSEDIVLAGKSTVSVMLNDKLIEVGGEELAEILQSIPSENISRIEVITNPPAKYDAAGNSGIINVITKKSSKNGFNGNVGLTYARNSFNSLQPIGAFNYRKGKWNIYGNTSGGDYYSKPVERQTTFYPNQTWDQVGNINSLRNYHRTETGIDYNVTPKALIGVFYCYGGSTPKSWDDISGKWLNSNNQVDSFVNTRAHTYDFGERNEANINYAWKNDSSGKKLNIDGDFFTRVGRTVRDFTTSDLYADGTSTGVNSQNKTTGKQVLYISSVKTDIELPTTIAKLSFGAKASFIHVLSDNVFQYLDSNQYITDISKTNKFDYHENTQALYLSAQKKANKQWDFQAGLRAEYTQTKATSITLNQTNETKYLELFPTAYAQYTHDEENVFNLNYSRRVERPNMSNINPFRRYTTLNSYEEGNPFLKPCFASNVEFSYTTHSKFTFTLFAQHFQQTFSQVLNIDTVLKQFHYTYANIGGSLNYGLSASASLSLTKWWESNTQFYGYNVIVNSNYYNPSVTNKYNLLTFVAQSDNSFILNAQKTLLAEVGFVYNAKMIEDYGLHYPLCNINSGMKALFFKKSLVIGFNVNDIFATEKIKIKNLYNGAITNNYYDERSIRINVTYKFGNKNIKSKRERTGGAAEESRRA